MQDSRDTTWAGRNNEPADATAEGNDTSGERNESDPDGWQQYRRWISKSPAPRSRRTGLDPSLYTWKGYRNWTEQVKRQWQQNQ